MSLNSLRKLEEWVNPIWNTVGRLVFVLSAVMCALWAQNFEYRMQEKFVEKKTLEPQLEKLNQTLQTFVGYQLVDIEQKKMLIEFIKEQKEVNKETDRRLDLLEKGKK